MFRRFAGALWAACLTAALAGAADPAPNPAPNPVLDRTVVDVLKDVHNRGAELYNRGDQAGCYRMYEGALVTARAFLAHQPAAQKQIDDALAEVNTIEGINARAFRLHEVIEKVRADLKPAAKPEPPKAEPKVEPKPEPKMATPKVEVPMPPKAEPKVEPKPPAPKVEPKPAAKEAAPGGGTVTLNGKPLAKAEVVMVSLTLARPRVLTATTDDAGRYAFAQAPPAAEYAVAVSGPGVPAKYQALATSGLRVSAGPAPAGIDLALEGK